jgi:hypothetical protein
MCKSLSLRFLSVWLLAAGLSAQMSALAAVQDCPTAQSGKLGFVVERGDLQKSEVFHEDDGIVLSVMRYNGTMLLERIHHEGLFELERLDRGVKTKFEPQIDLKTLFPLKPGRNIEVKFISESNGQHGTLLVQMTVKGADILYIGSCKYNVLKIERSESRSADPAVFVDTEYYSPELKLILAREFRKSNGVTNMIKYDRIYPLKRAAIEDSPDKPLIDRRDEGRLINSIKQMFDALGACWVPPPKGKARPGMEYTVVFAFKRDGELIAPPRVTYSTHDVPVEVRDSYRDSVNAALKRCTPMHFTESMAGAIAGKPIALRFIDDRIVGYDSNR